MDSISSLQGGNLSKFKYRLAESNCFFDGSCQRDACECFVTVLNILHIATKGNLIDDDSSSEDDECTISLTKRLFMFTNKRLHQCTTCRYLTTSYDQTLVHFVYPAGDCNIKNLLAKGIISSLTTECGKLETSHGETVKISTEIIAIVINRFDEVLRGGKANYKIG